MPLLWRKRLTSSCEYVGKLTNVWLYISVHVGEQGDRLMPNICQAKRYSEVPKSSPKSLHPFQTYHSCFFKEQLSMDQILLLLITTKKEDFIFLKELKAIHI